MLKRLVSAHRAGKDGEEAVAGVEGGVRQPPSQRQLKAPLPHAFTYGAAVFLSKRFHLSKSPVPEPLWRTLWGFLGKLKIELLHGPAIPLLGIFQTKL